MMLQHSLDYVRYEHVTTCVTKCVCSGVQTAAVFDPSPFRRSFTSCSLWFQHHMFHSHVSVAWWQFSVLTLPHNNILSTWCSVLCETIGRSEQWKIYWILNTQAWLAVMWNIKYELKETHQTILIQTCRVSSAGKQGAVVFITSF